MIEYGIESMIVLYLVSMNFWRKYETFFFFFRMTIWEYVGMTWRLIRMTRKGIGDDRDKSEYCTIFLAVFTISLARTDTCRLRFFFKIESWFLTLWCLSLKSYFYNSINISLEFITINYLSIMFYKKRYIDLCF